MHEIGIAAAVLSAAYFAAALVVRYGARRHAASVPAGPLPRVSVVIAARNEEANLPHLLESLRAQEYPADLWELIVVDDRSTDRTAEIVRAEAESQPRIRLVQVAECPPHLAGKQHALAAGIEQATGGIILMTDADCIVPPGWIRSMAAAFDEPSAGIATGLVEMPDSSRFWVNLQRADLAHLLATEWGAIGVGWPVTAIGNNLALRREAYDDAGGYAALPRTIVEDCAIVQAISRKGTWNAVMAHPEAAVETEPVPRVSSFFRQRARWSTGTFLLRPGQQSFIFAVFIQRVMTIAVTAFALLGIVQWWFPVVSWGFWLAGDALAICRYASVVNRWQLVAWAPVVTIWQAIYHVISGVWALFLPGRISWKGAIGTVVKKS